MILLNFIEEASLESRNLHQYRLDSQKASDKLAHFAGRVSKWLKDADCKSARFVRSSVRIRPLPPLFYSKQKKHPSRIYSLLLDTDSQTKVNFIGYKQASSLKSKSKIYSIFHNKIEIEISLMWISLDQMQSRFMK